LYREITYIRDLDVLGPTNKWPMMPLEKILAQLSWKVFWIVISQIRP
jgi:hypothetical protein